MYELRIGQFSIRPRCDELHILPGRQLLRVNRVVGSVGVVRCGLVLSRRVNVVLELPHGHVCGGGRRVGVHKLLGGHLPVGGGLKRVRAMRGRDIPSKCRGDSVLHLHGGKLLCICRALGGDGRLFSGPVFGGGGERVYGVCCRQVPIELG